MGPTTGIIKLTNSIPILFDTGALQGNYLSSDVGDWLRQWGAEPANEPSRICSAFNECKIINNLFSCTINFTPLVSEASNDTLHDIEAVLTQLSTHTAQRRNTAASIPAQGSAVTSVLPHSTTRS